jgi:biopolymer transport protein ExbB/TolQ
MVDTPLWTQFNVQAAWTFFQQGGLLMYPLLLFSVAVLAIALERWLRLRLARTDAEALYGIIEHMLPHQALERAQAHLSSSTPAP